MPNSNPHRTDASWRRVGLQLVSFCLPLVLVLAALERWAAGVPNMYSLKRQRLESLTNEVDTLIIGSSSAFHGIEPDLLSGSAFNLAGLSEPLYETDRLVTRVLPLLPKLKRVIVQVQYPTFFFSLTDAPENWRQYCYEQEWSIPPEDIKDWLDCRMWSRLALRQPYYYLDLLAKAAWGWVRTGTFDFGQPEFRTMDDRGWVPAVRVKAGPPDLLGLWGAKHQLAIHHGMMKAKYEPGNIVCLDHILSILRQRHIEVDLVTAPVWPSYLEVQSWTCWNETQRVVSQRTNNDGIYYYSFLTVPQMEPRDFYDVDHLAPSGAARFTKLLNAALHREQQHSDTKTSLESRHTAG
jgi:hypothetical protein